MIIEMFFDSFFKVIFIYSSINRCFVCKAFRQTFR